MSTVKVDTIQTTGGVSEIAIDKLKGVSAASSISVVGEGGTTTTNLQQGIAKCWFQITQDSSHSIDDSFNVGSIADGGAGETTVNFTNAMSNSDWSGLLTAQSSNNRRAVNNAPNTTRIKVETYQVDSNTSATDATGGVSGAVHGDLA
jgi:hypothetical protein